MKLVSLQEPISFGVKRSTGEFRLSFQAYTPYVISNANFKHIYANVEKILFKVSHYDYRMPVFNVHAARKGEPVMYFNGSGGFGDQIMSWPVVKILAKLGFDMHVCTEPGLELCWWHFPWVKSVTTLPMSQAQLEMWQHKAMMDAVVNFDEHPDQLHPIDTQLLRFGIDPNSVDPELKVVAPVFTDGEKAKARDLLGDLSKVGIYQLSATSPTRSLSTESSVQTLAVLASQFPTVMWIAIYDCFTDSDLVRSAQALPFPNVKPMTFAELRVLWATIGQAQVCVGPDSMLIHAAGSMGVPAVGLWGPMNPGNRVKYYRNHVPIWHSGACQFAPCFVSTHTFPKFCPPLPTPRETCAVIGKISPDEVCQAVSKILV